MTDLAHLTKLGERVRIATEARDAAIRNAAAAGASLRAIGDAVGLSHTGVAKIIARD